MTCLTAILKKIDYDLCVFTGDYRGQSFGPDEATLAGMSQICAELKIPIMAYWEIMTPFCMLPGLEEMGIRMLLNEFETIERNHQPDILPVSTMPIFIVRITSKKLRPNTE